MKHWFVKNLSSLVTSCALDKILLCNPKQKKVQKFRNFGETRSRRRVGKLFLLLLLLFFLWGGRGAIWPENWRAFHCSSWKFNLYIAYIFKMAWSFLTKLWPTNQKFREAFLHPNFQNLKYLCMRSWRLLVNTCYLEVCCQSISWKLILRIHFDKWCLWITLSWSHDWLFLVIVSGLQRLCWNAKL